MKNRFYQLSGSLICKLILLSILIVVTTILFTKEVYWIAIILSIISIFYVINIGNFHKKHLRKILFLLEAIENNDHAFNFPQEEQTHKDQLINTSLNRINTILYQVKQESIQKEKYYELITNMVNTGIIVANEKGYIEEINPKALELLGLEVLTHLKQLNRINDTLTDLFNTLTPETQTQISPDTNSEVKNISVRLSEIMLQEKRLRIFSLNNIKHELDKKETEAWVQLTRVLNHEIMNSLTPILSISDNLLSSTSSNSIKKELEIIKDTSKDLLNFVNSYRQFTNIPKPNPKLFHLAPFIKRMIELAKHQPTKAEIIFEDITQPEDLIIFTDEHLLSLVVTNLLKNAIEAIGENKKGYIGINSYCNEAETIFIEITNNGKAIPKEISDQIFIPFFTTKTTGNGIGLSTSRQIMYSCNGNLYLKSSSEEETTFILEFN